MTLSRAETGRLVASFSLKPSRALGQNFVADPNTVRRIARLAGVGPGDRVVEVGAGLGSLTLALAETGASVLALEKDHRLVPVLGKVLAERLQGPTVKVVEADAMDLAWEELLVPPRGWVLVANLPYNIATPLVVKLLDKVAAIERMLVLVQEEVARRFVAVPGDPAYGAVSAKLAYWAQARWEGAVASSVFVPQPRVGSALVSLRRRREPAVDPAVAPAELVFSLLRAGFATRRKMLRRALKETVPAGAFAAAGIDPAARAEQLGIGDWGRLAAAVARAGAARALAG
ncbi:MAG: 16S rRNA (adenine(1518)-N(6)/adenine(1519)-N(6))-dimethyltransferase RsmA [Acidimicrobiales bacterium]